jgi:abhydrolase domain-containing protein 13
MNKGSELGGKDGGMLSLIPLPNWLVNTTYTVLGVITIGLVLIYRFQDNLLYHPDIPGTSSKRPSQNPDGYRNPLESGHIQYEDALVNTADGEKIHTWLMLQKKNPENCPTLIYFHGNAGNMGFRLPNSINMYLRCGMNILTMDYRGYGDSTGIPTEVGLELDAEAVLQHAISHPKLKNSPMILFGRSLGGAVAISLAHKFPNDVSGIVVENTFSSISDMVDVLMPWVAFAKNLVLRIGWDSSAKIPEIKCPIYFISGDADTLVPPPQMKKLYDTALNSVYKEFFSVSGGGHNDSFIVAGIDYYKRLREFVSRSEVLTFSKKKGNVSLDAQVCGDDNVPLVEQKNALPTMQTNFSID